MLAGAVGTTASLYRKFGGEKFDGRQERDAQVPKTETGDRCSTAKNCDRSLMLNCA